MSPPYYGHIAGLSKEEVDLVLRDLSVEDLVFYNSFVLKDSREFLFIADMRRLSEEEFERRSNLCVFEEYRRDFCQTSLIWTRDLRDYLDYLKTEATGRHPNHDDLNMEMINKMLSRSKECRVFYSLKYPERMEDYVPVQVGAA